MLTALLIGAGGAAIGAVLGVWTRRTLATLNYRHDDEQGLPSPGSRRWIIWVSALSLGSIAAWLAATNAWALAPTVLPLTLSGPALAAIDLDAMRLPNRILLPVAIAILAGVASTVVTQGGWTVCIRAALGGLIAGGTLGLLGLITRGGVGTGDVKLATILGTAVGTIGLTEAWWALVLGSIAALLWAEVRRWSGELPYGPWLLLGAWTATVCSSL